MLKSKFIKAFILSQIKSKLLNLSVFVLIKCSIIFKLVCLEIISSSNNFSISLIVKSNSVLFLKEYFNLKYKLSK